MPRRTPSWTRALLRTLLPSSCALCAADCDAAVCRDCQQHYLGQPVARCRQCGNPMPASMRPEHAPGATDAGMAPALERGSTRKTHESLDLHDDAVLIDADQGNARRRERRPVKHLCGTCLSHARAFDATLVAADYASPLDQLVLQLKFGGRLALAPWCAQRLVDAVLADSEFVLPTVLCPVPLGRQRLSERGFNQSLEIARPLSKALGVALWPQLALRTRETQAQSTLAPAARLSNLRNAFMVSADYLGRLHGQHVGIVDDVMTSGQTLDELAGTLKRFGAARVSNLVFARTPPH